MFNSLHQRVTKVTIKSCNIGTTLPVDYIIKHIEYKDYETDSTFLQEVNTQLIIAFNKFDSVEIFKHTQ